MKRDNDKSAPGKALYNWYPGHMAKALREVKKRLTLVDIVLEIRDARVPLATGNRSLDAEVGNKVKLIVLNKANLAVPEAMNEWTEWFTAQDKPFVFVDCFDKPALKKIVSMARKLVEKNRRDCNPGYVQTKTKLKMMIVGLPNTGKSTIINQLANRGATKVADKPGYTTIQQWIIIDNEVELLDTPGIMPPMIEKDEHALWLSAIHAIPDDIAGEETTAIFVINHLIKHKTKEFFDRFKIESPDITVEEALLKVATLRGCLRQKGQPDLERVYKLILAEFRTGELGRASFGVPPKK